MKITIKTDERLKDTEITIACGSLTPELEKVIATLRMLDRQLTVEKDGETFLLELGEVLYIDTVDKRTFIYTVSNTYETSLKLYELEAQLRDAGFLRVGKSCILNLKRIRSLKADIDRRIRVTMENKEQVIVSRQYAEALKERLGIGRKES